jgi:hypothetical protein
MAIRKGTVRQLCCLRHRLSTRLALLHERSDGGAVLISTGGLDELNVKLRVAGILPLSG